MILPPSQFVCPLFHFIILFLKIKIISLLMFLLYPYFIFKTIWKENYLIFTLLQPFSLPYHFISPLLLQFFSLPYLFIYPLPSILILFILFSLIVLYFYLFLFTPSYYKFVTISFILCIVFPHKKKKGSLSLSLNFLVDFFFPLHLYFRLIIFYIL